MRLLQIITLLLCGVAFAGCESPQPSPMYNNVAGTRIGYSESHNVAGTRINYKPLVRECVGQLLERVTKESIQQVGFYADSPFPPTKRKVCFVGLENTNDVEDLADFNQHIKSVILESISSSERFEAISDRAVTTWLRSLHLQAEDLFIQENMQQFTSAMGRDGMPVDYLLFAKITSETTGIGRDTQRHYNLTLELINAQTCVPIIESTLVRKEHHSVPGQADSLADKVLDRAVDRVVDKAVDRAFAPIDKALGNGEQK